MRMNAFTVHCEYPSFAKLVWRSRSHSGSYRANCSITILSCVAFGLVISAGISSHAEVPEDVEIRPLVRVCPVIQQDVASQVSHVATVVPMRRTVVGTAVDGRVEFFLNTPADPEVRLTRVHQGDVLARLKTDVIERSLAAAKAELRLRRHELEELQNGARPEEIEASQANLDRLQALRDLTATRLDRARTLFERNATISRDEFDLAVANATEADHALTEARAKHALVVAGPRPEQIQQAEARVEAQLQLVLQHEDTLTKHSIVAPFDGYVVAEHTEVGAWVSRGDPVVEMIQLDTIELEAFLPARYAVTIPIGTEIDVTIEAMPNEKLRGTIDRIVPQADERSRTFPVRVRMQNPQRDGRHLLMAGMLGQVLLPVGESKAALMVPKDALVLGGRTPLVYVIDPPATDGEFVARAVPVQLGIARGHLIQVVGELTEGDRVVERGNEGLKTGLAVRIAPAVVGGG